VFRYGTDRKMGAMMPAVHFYQNTFVAANADDKAGALTLLFAAAGNSPDVPRVHLNNLRLGVDLDAPLSWGVPPSPVRRSEGHLWHLFHRASAPWFLWDDGPPVESLDSLGEAQARGCERFSATGEPRLANFDDEIFMHGLYLGDAYPDNDFRPGAGSPALAAGVVLPSELTDPDRPSGGMLPDIGALAAGSAPARRCRPTICPSRPPPPSSTARAP
jgi:hypothetical protein